MTSSFRAWRWPARVAPALAVLGCGTTTEPEPTALGPPDLPAPVFPTATSLGPNDDEPAWLKRLPERAPVAKTGDEVWAVVPAVGTLAQVGVFRVAGVYDGLYSLSDRAGTRRDGIRPAAVHRTGSRPATTSGALVLCHTPTTSAVLARLEPVTPGAALRVRYDWAGVSKTTEIDHFERPRVGVQPLAYVGHPYAGGMSRGLVVALDETSGWVLTDSGHVVTHPREALAPVPLPTVDHDVGANVVAYRWGTGFFRGTVRARLENGARFRVQPVGDRPPADLFFSAVYPRDQNASRLLRE
ncbi:MAG: hypothetical protein AAF928_02755 [Myxococcota bacterium]